MVRGEGRRGEERRNEEGRRKRRRNNERKRLRLFSSPFLPLVVCSDL